MVLHPRPARRACIALLLIVSLPATAAAQHRFPPDSLINVKVLPRTMTVPELVGMMKGFTSALGIRCSTCHVGSESQELEAYDFPSDSLRMKRVAREMIRMVQAINQQTLANLPERPVPNVAVTCMTCHRGVRRPATIQDLVLRAFDTGGVDSAAHTYRALRDRYYGSDSYNFAERALNDVAMTLVSRGRQYDAALGILALNGEFFPHGAGVMATTGDLYRMRGDTTLAVRAYRTALERDPQNGVAQFWLQQLGQRP